MSGTWSGTSQNIVLELTLTQAGTGGGVTGSGIISGGGGGPSTTVTVDSGTHVYPMLSLVLDPEGFISMDFTATLVAPGFLAGELNGSGFDEFVINLSKQ